MDGRSTAGWRNSSRRPEFEQRTAPGKLEAVFIRAPIIREVGRGGRVLARYDGDPVLMEQGRHLVATFHPELTDDSGCITFSWRSCEPPLEARSVCVYREFLPQPDGGGFCARVRQRRADRRRAPAWRRPMRRARHHARDGEKGIDCAIISPKPSSSGPRGVRPGHQYERRALPENLECPVGNGTWRIRSA